MTTVESFLTHLSDLEVRLWVEGDRLRCNAPKGVLTPELRTTLAERKAEIIALLEQSKRRVVADQTIVPVERNGPLPLSFGQERLWFIDQLEGQSAAYNLSGVFQLEGTCSHEALAWALTMLIRRHEILRTTFPERDGAPVQQITPAEQATLALELRDLRALPLAAARADAQSYARHEVRQPFDLARGPLLRVLLQQLADDEQILVVTMHHIVADGWSMGRFIDEFTTLYQAFLRGNTTTPTLPDLAIQYADYAAWQRRQIKGSVLDQQLDYWRRQLADAPDLLQLPTDRPRPAARSFAGGTYHFAIDAAATGGIKRIGQQCGATLYMTLLSAFALLLQRYSQQDDLLIGSPIANRTRAETEPLIGFFLNTLVLRLQIDPQRSFAELLRQARQVTLDGFAHQDVPFGQVVDTLNPERNLGYNPLFQVMFDLQNAPAGTLELPDLAITPLIFPADKDETQAGSAMFDLSLTIQEAGERLTGQLEYSSDLFDLLTMQRLIEHFTVLLHSIAADPQQPVARLPILAAAERRLLLDEWSQVGTTSEAASCVHELIAAQARRTPDAVAVAFQGRHLTYAILDERANQMAHYLQSLGVGAQTDSLVGVCLERSPDLIVAVLGVLKAGAAYVPLDPSYPPERLQFMLDDAQVALLLTQTSLLDQLPQHSATTVCLDRDWPTISAYPTIAPPAATLPAHSAYVIYTSGSTGQPKGVVIAHETWASTYAAWEAAYGLRSGPSSHLQMAAFSFDVFAGDFVRALCSGGKLVLCPREYLLSPEDLYRLMRKEQVDSAEFVPAVLRGLVQYLEETGQNLRFMRLLIAGSDSWYVDEYKRFQRLCGPQTRLINSYGVTEAAIDSTFFEQTALLGAGERLVPIGRPFPNTRIYILDQQQQPTPIGVPGELYLGGDRLARGYLNRPGLTAERFVDDPFDQRSGARLYRTGDAARYLPDGNIEYLGRIDQQVKLRGFRIELGEIEATLLQHPHIAEAVVIVREERAAGAAATKQLVAYVVENQEPRTGCPLGDQEPNGEENETQTSIAVPPRLRQRERAAGGEGLRTFLGARLPDYMIPSAFVLLDGLPLTPNGKINRRALPAPTSAAPASSATAAPRTPIETTLAQIWTDVLRLPQVGIHDNFFGLGGDSILSIQVIARARQAGLHLTPKQLFQHQTIAELATVVTSSAAVAAQQDLVTGAAPLTPIQRWFFEQAAPNMHHDNQAVLLRVAPDLNPALVAQALDALVVQHDALRLRFAPTSQGWTQEHGPALPVECAVVDLRDLPAADREAALIAQATTIQASLDLTDGPLLRAALFHLADDEPARLLLVIHHLVVDGVSWRILLEDFATAYTQLAANQAIQLPPKTTAYARWATQLVAYAQSETLAAERIYWLAQVAQPLRALPVDDPAGLARNIIAQATSVSTALSVDETAALLQQVPQAYHTQINDVLLTALAQTLGAWSGTSAVRIDLEGHGREEIDPSLDLTRTVGWFTTVAPVVLPVVTDDPGAALKTIKETLRAIPQRGLGYGLLRYLHPDDGLRTQLARQSAEVSFNYLGQFDQVLTAGPLLGLAPEDSGPEQDPQTPRAYLVDVTAHVADGQLHVTWVYSQALHTPTTIARVADDYQQALRALIAHCQSPAAGGFTPSDFPEAALSQAQLDALISQVAAHTGVRKPPIEALYPLTPMQEGMLFHTLVAPESGVYVEQVACRLEGSINTAAFRQAWETVVARHAVFRTAMLWENLEQPLQMVLSQVALPFVEYDWRAYGAAEQAAALADLRLSERARGFTLQSAPLQRWALVRLAEDTYYFIWTHHHLLLDGWSVPLVFAELFAAYQALCQGQAPQLPAIRPYRDYIRWLLAQDRSQAENFWRPLLAGIHAPTPLPGSRATSAPAAYEIQQLLLPAKATADLQAFVRAHHLTLNTLLQGAWALLLHHYSGERDVLFGATVAARPAALPGVEEMVGLFINTLPVRATIDDQSSLLAWLEALHALGVEQNQYAYNPLVEIQGWSEIPRGTPLFESILVFENYPIADAVDASQQTLAVSEVATTEQTNFPLTLLVVPGAELKLSLSYDRARFDAPLIARMLDHLAVLLAEFSADPQRQLSRLNMLTHAERQQLLGQWNATALAYPHTRCLHELLADQAARTPNAIAVVDGAGTRERVQLTYAELDARANQLAHRLRGLGVGPDILVGLCVERSLDMIVALLGILKAGGAYLPLDPSYPADRIEFMIHDAQIRVLLTEEHLAASLPASAAAVLCLDHDWATIAEQPDSPLPNYTQPEHLAYVIYTSGSTGRPKGVQIPHRAAVNFLASMHEQPGLSSDDTLLAVTTLSFDIAVLELYLPLLHGAQVVLAPRDVSVDAAALADLLHHSGTTIMQATPATWRMLLASGWSGNAALKVLCGGEALAPDLLEQLRPRVGAIWNMYGPTETTVWSTLARVDTQHDLPADLAAPIGRPIANTQIYILNRQLEPVPVGVAGELYIGGTGMARGYLNRPELTAERFIPDPFGAFSHGMTGARLYRTGDLARYREDGQIEYLGRIDQQVKLRGFRIELGEIEAALMDHPAIRQAAVAVRDERLVAYVIPEKNQEPRTKNLGGEEQGGRPLGEGTREQRTENKEQRSTADSPSPAATEAKACRGSGKGGAGGEGLLKNQGEGLIPELRSHLGAHLPAYMVPSIFVTLDAFPLTPNGKLDRKALPAPDGTRVDPQQGYVAPRDTLEVQLVRIWEDVLGVSPISVRDSFFELGGHSLLAVRLMAQIQQIAGNHLPLATLYEAATVEQMAALLRQRNSDRAWSPLVKIQAGSRRQPFFCVPGAGGNVVYLHALARHLGPDQPFYSFQARGLDGLAEPHTRVEEIAAEYVAALQTVQPHGPYILGGHSFGVTVAYEMARQLQQQGEQITLLVSLDSPPPPLAPQPDARANWSMARWVVAAAELAESMSDAQLDLDETQLQDLDADAQIELLTERLKGANILPPETSATYVRGFVNVFRANHQAQYARDAVQPLPIALFRARDEQLTAEEQRDPTWGWDAVSDGPPQLYAVPGDHLTMMSEPQVAQVAAQLQQCLGQIQ